MVEIGQWPTVIFNSAYVSISMYIHKPLVCTIFVHKATNSTGVCTTNNK